MAEGKLARDHPLVTVAESMNQQVHLPKVDGLSAVHCLVLMGGEDKQGKSK